jgi:coatomer protein complex subunit gamma
MPTVVRFNPTIHLTLISASPFADLEKATVLQECRVFSDAKVVTESPRKCSQLITKLLHIVTQGDAMSSSEVTEVFFGVTKLFQSTDASLRRMVYFFIKEVVISAGILHKFARGLLN